MLLQQIPQFLVSGITNGSIYALIAFGFCLIQNATGLVNFAQGDFVMLGAMIMIYLQQVAHLPVMAALPPPVGWKPMAVATPVGPGGVSCMPWSLTGSRRGTAN